MLHAALSKQNGLKEFMFSIIEFINFIVQTAIV